MYKRQVAYSEREPGEPVLWLVAVLDRSHQSVMSFYNTAEPSDRSFSSHDGLTFIESVEFYVGLSERGTYGILHPLCSVDSSFPYRAGRWRVEGKS